LCINYTVHKLPDQTSSASSPGWTRSASGGPGLPGGHPAPAANGFLSCPVCHKLQSSPPAAVHVGTVLNIVLTFFSDITNYGGLTALPTSSTTITSASEGELRWLLFLCHSADLAQEIAGLLPQETFSIASTLFHQVAAELISFMCMQTWLHLLFYKIMVCHGTR